MIRLDEILTPNDVKAIQYSALADRETEYLTKGQDRSDIVQRISNVRDADIRRVLRAIDPFEREQGGAAWSHCMALFAGRHLFPDANHRTGLIAFNQAIFRAWSEVYLLIPAARGREMVEESKAMRDRDYLALGRYYTAKELGDSNHPYRIVFRAFEPHLIRYVVKPPR